MTNTIQLIVVKVTFSTVNAVDQSCRLFHNSINIAVPDNDDLFAEREKLR
jgi:hypothetical protein